MIARTQKVAINPPILAIMSLSMLELMKPMHVGLASAIAIASSYPKFTKVALTLIFA